MNNNQQLWGSSAEVKAYTRQSELNAPEKVLLKSIAKKELRTSMLDLGVGAGRTTEYFASLFNIYFGIDYSLGMINACLKKFWGNTNYHFYAIDALNIRYISWMPDMDFIFFSAQGICYFDTMEQVQAMISLCSRLLNPDGVFAFSIQNSLSLQEHYRFHVRKNPFRIIPEFLRWRKIRSMNGSIDQYQGKLCYQITDGMISWQIHPEYMRGLLSDAGFKRIDILNEQGIIVASDSKPEDFHLHFICYK
jgi:SAM-dependent methyltransferase